uniref:JmjC domain-containing protein n=1 Tax=Skeletonema marinoi TaxID=267567 RepID=A0A7S2M337_9STRA
MMSSRIYYAILCCIWMDGLATTDAFMASRQAAVPRITLEEFLAAPIRDKPIIIRDIVSPEDIESLADDLLSTLGKEQIQMQHKIKDDDGKTITEIYDLCLFESVEYMMDSEHDDSFFAFVEGLLPSSTTTKLHKQLTDIREAPYPQQEDWFDYFPENIRPSDAIILAGEGAVSTLHRDPFEWTGTSLCLEGVKIWRFIPTPATADGGVAKVDKELQSYRLDSIAWEQEENQQSVPLVLSAGWQSDMTLYDSIDEDFPTAFEWASMEEENNTVFRNEIISQGSDSSRLRPSSVASDALKSIDDTTPFVTATQFAGDLLLIPAHCWHQTYAPVPSIAVASQRCGISDGAKVVQHVIDLTKNDRIKVPDILQRREYKEEGIGKQVVTELLGFAIDSNTA